MTTTKTVYQEATNSLINFELKSIAFFRFDCMREYISIVSPFSRLYLITEGFGWIMLDDEKIQLEPNFLYLIPSYTSCSYHFNKGLKHYYAHFSTTLINGLNVYNLYEFYKKVASTALDYLLFKRLLEINPDQELPHHNPNVYQKKEWMNKKSIFTKASHYIESRGIQEQLLSHLIDQEIKPLGNLMLRYNLQSILAYIQTNIKRNIDVSELARMACLSNDHFSKVFKSIVSQTPSEYIIKKRIEKAQLLLLTSDMPLKQIIEETGFGSLSYFSRVFKKHILKTPVEYRKMRG